jgi:hypothetical protein
MMKKALAYGIIIIMAIAVVILRKYQERQTGQPATVETRSPSGDGRENLARFRDPGSEYFFTKHARCRMDCRKITQKEVKEIVRQADVNYNKSDLQSAQGSRYAVEGYTSRDRQHVRVIVAPKQRHLSIVTVIDLDKDWPCPSCD